MKKTIFFIIICVLIWDFISTQSTVIPSFIPINEGIPDNELSRLSLEVLPIISHKFKIQIFSDRIRIDSRPKCYNSQGFDGKDTVKVSVFFSFCRICMQLFSLRDVKLEFIFVTMISINNVCGSIKVIVNVHLQVSFKIFEEPIKAKI